MSVTPRCDDSDDEIFDQLMRRVGLKWEVVPELDPSWTEFPASSVIGFDLKPADVEQDLLRIRAEDPWQYETLAFTALSAPEDDDAADIVSLYGRSVSRGRQRHREGDHL